MKEIMFLCAIILTALETALACKCISGGHEFVTIGGQGDCKGEGECSASYKGKKFCFVCPDEKPSAGSYRFWSTPGCNSEGTQEPACGQGDVTVVSGTTYHSRFSVKNLLTHENKDISGKNYWLSPDGSVGTFILNMGCALSFDAIRLVNTHNTDHRDRSTRRFRLFTSMSQSGPWTQVLDKELEDSRRQQDPLPLQIIALDTAAVSAQFLKFEGVTRWGTSSGLQYFDIQRD